MCGQRILDPAQPPWAGHLMSSEGQCQWRIPSANGVESVVAGQLPRESGSDLGELRGFRVCRRSVGCLA